MANTRNFNVDLAAVVEALDFGLQETVMGWRSMDTAPKNGQWVLAVDARSTRKGSDMPPIAVVRAKRPESMWQDYDDRTYGKLTHWMPCPSLPNAPVMEALAPKPHVLTEFVRMLEQTSPLPATNPPG